MSRVHDCTCPRLAHALGPNRKLISCSLFSNVKSAETPCEFTGRKLAYKFNKLTLNAYLNFRNLATKMQLRGGHLCFHIVTVRHKETLGEKIESAHDCKTDENS